MSEPGPIRLRDEAVTWRVVDGEVIVLDRRNWAYLSVNGSGALLWDALVSGATEDELAQTLVGEFVVEAGRARDDVARFVGALRRHDLLAASP
jgi:hypothetical protein